MSVLAQKRIGGGAEFHLGRIEEWLKDKLLPDARPKTVEVDLCHHVQLPDGGEDVQIIDRIKIEKSQTAETIATRLYDCAKAAVEAFTRPQRFGIVAIESPESVVGRYSFLLSPPPSSQIGGETEPANSTGVLAQIMRHYEANTRLMIMSQQHATSILETELERVRSENDKLRQSHFQMIQAREDLLDRSAERAMRLRHEQAEMARGERWVNRAEQLIGALVEGKLQLPPGSISGGPTGAGASPGAVQKWLATLSEEQRGKLTGALDEILTEDQAKDFLETITGGKD